MKITKRQLKQIIKEEISRNILIEKKKKKKKKKKPKIHRYDKKVSKAYDRSESNTDVADDINIDVSDVLGDDHPLAKRISDLIDRQEDDFEDLLDEIQWAIEDPEMGPVPADIKDKLLANGNF